MKNQVAYATAMWCWWAQKVSSEWATVTLAAIVNVKQASLLPQSMANVT